MKYWWKGDTFPFSQVARPISRFWDFSCGALRSTLFCGTSQIVTNNKLKIVTNRKWWQSGKYVFAPNSCHCHFFAGFVRYSADYLTTLCNVLHYNEYRNHNQEEDNAIWQWNVCCQIGVFLEIWKVGRRGWCWINLEDPSCHWSKWSAIVPPNSHNSRIPAKIERERAPFVAEI